jgi:hypothetical protein
MNAPQALAAAREAGVTIQLDRGDLVLNASTKPPQAIIDGLARRKREIISLIRSQEGWAAGDWRVFFDERAGIGEFDGGCSRPHAEMRAYESCIAEWSWRNFECSPPDRCAQCGRQPEDLDPLVPIGIEHIGHAWLHDDCWQDWYLAQRRRAASALEALGIIRPVLRPSRE